jgi:hypothetical protein
MNEEDIEQLVWLDTDARMKGVSVRYEVRAYNELTNDWPVIHNAGHATEISQGVDDCLDNNWKYEGVRLTREVIQERS